MITPIDEVETCELPDALHRVCATDLKSPVDVPAFMNSAMDGYALRQADLTGDGPFELPLQGTSLAGHPFTAALLPGHAIRIFTGAMLPPGADTIELQENVTADDAKVSLNSRPPVSRFIRPIGHDVAAGALLSAKGERLSAFHLAAATTSGVQQVSVQRRLRVGVFATGDELREPGQPLAAGDIYESNRIAIRSLLTELPVDVHDLGVLPDDADITRDRLGVAAQQFDALITSGGVSVGDADFVRGAIEENGSLDFWRLNLRPGKPFAFGRIGTALIFGLPGNPVSSIVTLLLLVKPALWHLAGASPRPLPWQQAELVAPLQHSTGRDEYQRGTLRYSQERTSVSNTSDQSSNRLQSFAGANCLIRLPGDQADFPAGSIVATLPFAGL